MIVFRPLMVLLRTQNLPDRTQTLVQKVIVAVIFMQFVWSLSDTFYILFVIDSVGYTQLGILVAISFLLQSTLDYPSGVLGDWIGQKWVLFSALLTFGVSFCVLAFSQSFEMLLVVYCLQALAASQESGALMSWFDNNYKATANDADPDRKTYKFFYGRWGLITNVTGAVGFLIGGLLATIYFRQAIFAFQGVALIIIACSFPFFLNDYPEVEKTKRSVKNYVKLLGEGIKIVFWNKGLLIYVISICCFGMLWSVWGIMILYPLYFGYTGSDAGAGIFRFIVWITGLPAAYFAANLGAKLEIKWIPRLQFLHTIVFFPLFVLLFWTFPIDKDRFEPLGILLTIGIFGSTIILNNINGILEQRVFLDAIPDKNRNSVYSLVPTLVLILSAPAVIIGGYLIVNSGVPTTLLFLSVLSLVGSVFSYIGIKLMFSEVTEPQLTRIESEPEITPSQVSG